MSLKPQHILVIRLGALGDLIFCFQSFHEIRKAHPDAVIALLTRPAFASFAKSLPWFDEIIIESHPRFRNILEWLRLRRNVARFAPDVVYDLQGKRRQSILYALLGGPMGPAWSGAAPLCQYPRLWPPGPGMHFMDFLAAQLRLANVGAQARPDLSWLDANIAKFALPSRYAVLIPGCSPDAPHKRWPPSKYAALSRKLASQGMPCVAVGTEADRSSIDIIRGEQSDLIDLAGKTSVFELAAVLRGATVVIGNDTGPTHLAGIVGAPTLALFSQKSSLAWSKPPGDRSDVLKMSDLKDLSVETVSTKIQTILA